MEQRGVLASHVGAHAWTVAPLEVMLSVACGGLPKQPCDGGVVRGLRAFRAA
jgi:hypothetical protein